MILGFDVSHWNNPDFPDLFNSGSRFCWLKATEGTTFTDGKFFQHRSNAKDAGLKTGGYHYFRAAWAGKSQAEHFFSIAGDDYLPPALDVERTNNLGFSQSVFQERLFECVSRCLELFDQRPVIYTSQAAWGQLIGNASWAANFPLWVAHYTTASSPLMPNDWADWAVWQFTNTPLDTNRMKEAFWDSLGGVQPQPDPALEERVSALENWGRGIGFNA